MKLKCRILSPGLPKIVEQVIGQGQRKSSSHFVNFITTTVDTKLRKQMFAETLLKTSKKPHCVLWPLNGGNLLVPAGLESVLRAVDAEARGRTAQKGRPLAQKPVTGAGIFKQSMGIRNQVGL
jgi:hypothetical protein